MTIDTSVGIRLDEEVRALCEAVTSIEDPLWVMQLRLAATVLSNSSAELVQRMNARSVSDFEFALNDLVAAVSELMPEDQAIVAGPLARVSRSLEMIRRETRLPSAVVESIRQLQGKLRERSHAIERDTFRPPEDGAATLPNDPTSLRSEAERLQESLRKNGYDTPMLDQLIDDPASMRLRQIGDLVDELDVIAG